MEGGQAGLFGYNSVVFKKGGFFSLGSRADRKTKSFKVVWSYDFSNNRCIVQLQSVSQRFLETEYE